MNNWRSTAYSAFFARKGEAFSDVFDAADESAKKSISMFFHYLEKIAALREAKLVDEKLLKSILGRYIAYWFAEIIDPMQAEPAGSDWVGMLTKIKTLKALVVE